jgi:hypothetical protein
MGSAYDEVGVGAAECEVVKRVAACASVVECQTGRRTVRKGRASAASIDTVHTWWRDPAEERCIHATTRAARARTTVVLLTQTTKNKRGEVAAIGGFIERSPFDCERRGG